MASRQRPAGSTRDWTPASWPAATHASATLAAATLAATTLGLIGHPGRGRVGFITVKVTEGDYYVNPYALSHLTQARSLSLYSVMTTE